MNILVERLRRLPQRHDECWQGGFFRMPAWVDDGDDGPYRPYALGWIAVKADLIFMGEVTKSPDYTIVLKSLADFADDRLVGGYRPGRVEVASQELLEEIREPLAEAGIVAEFRAELPAFERMTDEMALKMTGEGVPGMLTVKGVTIERVRAFAEAAREYYLAAPWEVFSPDDVVEIESPFIDGALRYGVIMGQGGEFYGIGFFSDMKTVKMASDKTTFRQAFQEGLWHLSFDAQDGMPGVDLHFWERYDLPLASPEAYPFVCVIGSRKPRRPGPDYLAWFEGLLRAIVRCKDDAVASNRCTVAVETANGPMEFVLSFDSIGNNTTGGPLPAPRAAMERTMMDISDGLDSPSEKGAGKPKRGNAATHGTIDSNAGRRAQKMMYDAWEMSGRQQISMARKALEIYRDCTDAYVLLGSRMDDPQKALETYRQGVEAGRRSLGSRRFKEDAGVFWGILETRPFMRALLGVGQCLEVLARFDEARECYDELLRLNPNDNQGVRDVYVLMLMKMGLDADAQKLIERYKDDDYFALWLYCRAFIAFRREGDTASSRKMMEKAVKKNQHLARYLIDPESVPNKPIDSYSIGSPEEALAWYYDLMPIMKMTAGLEEWIAGIVNKSGKRPGRKRTR